MQNNRHYQEKLQQLKFLLLFSEQPWSFLDIVYREHIEYSQSRCDLPQDSRMSNRDQNEKNEGCRLLLDTKIFSNLMTAFRIFNNRAF